MTRLLVLNFFPAFVPPSSVLTDIEYSGPSNSIDSRKPAPTKLHEVVASTTSGVPASSTYVTVARAQSSAGCFP